MRGFVCLAINAIFRSVKNSIYCLQHLDYWAPYSVQFSIKSNSRLHFFQIVQCIDDDLRVSLQHFWCKLHQISIRIINNEINYDRKRWQSGPGFAKCLNSWLICYIESRGSWSKISQKMQFFITYKSRKMLVSDL